MSKIALKRLTYSDITIIARHFYRRRDAGDTTAQKSIALPRTTFIDELFPDLPKEFDKQEKLISRPTGGPKGGHKVAFEFTLDVYGPADSPPFRADAKVTRTQKNWRLNGFFRDPTNQEANWKKRDRFSGMLPEDLSEAESLVRENNIAIMEFFGDRYPVGGKIAFVNSSVRATRSLFRTLSDLIDEKKAVSCSVGELRRAFDDASLTPQHPFREFLGEPDAEELLQDDAEPLVHGVATAVRRAGGVRKSRTLTREQFLAWREAADAVGTHGEALAYHHLRRAENTTDVVWVSRSENYVSPYDFTARRGGVEIKIEVKSTSGGFHQPIYVSLGELIEAANSDGSYELWRISEVTPTKGVLRICKSFKEFAKYVLSALDKVHNAGVSADSLSFFPESLKFGGAQEIALPAHRRRS